MTGVHVFDGNDEMSETWQIPKSQRVGATPELYVCQALSRSVPFDAAAVVVATGMDSRYPLAGSDPQLRRFGDMQQTVAQGPGFDAWTVGSPVLVLDLAAETGQWPLLDATGVDVAVRTLGLFPLLDPAVGSRRLQDAAVGLLVVARHTVAAFSPGELTVLTAASRLLAAMVVEHVPAWTGPSDGTSGSTSADPLGDDDLPVAVGVVMARLHIGRHEALARMRAHAFAHGDTLQELAARVLTGAPIALDD